MCTPSSIGIDIDIDSRDWYDCLLSSKSDLNLLGVGVDPNRRDLFDG